MQGDRWRPIDSAPKDGSIFKAYSGIPQRDPVTFDCRWDAEHGWMRPSNPWHWVIVDPMLWFGPRR